MKRLVYWAVLAASLSANLGVAAAALWRWSSASSNEPYLFSRVALDAGQRTRISELRSEIMARRTVDAGRIAELRAQLVAAIAQEPEDPASVDSVLGRIVEAQAGLQQAVVGHVIAVRAVLRPEQRPAFEQMVAEHMRIWRPDAVRAGPATRGPVNR